MLGFTRKEGAGVTAVKAIISMGAVTLIAVHLAWPQLTIDAITLGMLLVAILPWLSTIIESAKFPGGWEVKFRDLQAAGEKIAHAKTGVPKPKSLDEFLQVATADPNLALVGLRIEIEKRLRRLATQTQISDHLPLTRMFSELHQRGLLRESVFSALQEIVGAGNKAAHGASVEPAVLDWALSTGPQILAVLDELLQRPEP